MVVFFSKNGLMNELIAHHLQHCQVMYGITLQDFWASIKLKIIPGDGQTPLGGRDKKNASSILSVILPVVSNPCLGDRHLPPKCTVKRFCYRCVGIREVRFVSLRVGGI